MLVVITLSSPCQERRRLGLDTYAHFVPPGGKGDGDGEKSGGETASKRARDIEGDKKGHKNRVRSAVTR